jgi:hypothetical protein
MKRIVWMVPWILAACGSGADTVDFELRGRVLLGPLGTDPVAGVRVSLPSAGRSTVTDADGNYRVSASVAKTADDSPPRVGVWFSKEGLATVPKSLQALDGAKMTLVALMGWQPKVQAVQLPTTAPDASVQFGKHSMTVYADSFQDAKGKAASGTVTLAATTWDPTLEDLPWFPLVPGATALDGTAPFLSPLAVIQFDASQDGKPLAVGGTRGVGLALASASLLDPVQATDNRLFRVDPDSGLLVERTGAVTTPQALSGGILRAPVDSAGTYVWAKAVASPTCVTVTVLDASQQPVVGAQVRISEVVVIQEIRILDEAVGGPEGLYCLRGPVGKVARLHAWFHDNTTLRVETAPVTLSGAGSCETGCPQNVTLAFKCAADTDCAKGATCQAGACVAGAK